MIQAAILDDAAADLVGIVRQMTEAPSNVLLVGQGLAAVCVLDRTTRLLEGQRAALLDQLTEIVLAAPRADAPPAERSRARPVGAAGNG
jgi:hypothetical protein